MVSLHKFRLDMTDWQNNEIIKYLKDEEKKKKKKSTLMTNIKRLWQPFIN